LAPFYAAGPDVGAAFFLGGYVGRSSELWSVRLRQGQSHTVELVLGADDGGWHFGGSGSEAVARIMGGFSVELPGILAEYLALDTPATRALVGVIGARLRRTPTGRGMPLRRAVEFADWLVDAACDFEAFTERTPSVVRPVDLAAVSPAGFQWLRPEGGPAPLAGLVGPAERRRMTRGTECL
jgi:hypothetical protein